MPRLVLVDGYVDEPAQFGVPPYISPEARYIWGAARAAGCEGEASTVDGVQTTELAYVTIDTLRREPGLLGALLPSDLVVVLASCVVPGKYLRGEPIRREEAERILRVAKQKGTFTILAGACARFGFSTGGGRPLEPLTPLEPWLDRKCPDHADAFVHDTLLALADGAEPPGPFRQRKRTDAEWDRWAILGADVVVAHPDHPELLTAEIDTYTGCARYIDGGCRFCMEPLEGKPRYRDEPMIEAEVARLAALGVRNFRLGGQACFYSYKARGVGIDADPEPDVDAVRRLLEGVRRAAPNLRVLHIDNANPTVLAKFPDATRAITRLLMEHGTDGNVAAFGLESMDPGVQAACNLNTTAELALDATRLLNEEGRATGPAGQPWVLPGFNFISGLPGEGKDTFGYNERFLQQVWDEGLMVRRVNLRQILPSRPGMEPMAKKAHGPFVSFKRRVRESFDHPMLTRVFPIGTVLRDVYMETRDGQITFGRPLGSYPILVGVPYEVELETFHDVVVTDHGKRSVTGFVTPFPAPTATLRMWQSLPGIGKKRAAHLKLGRPKDAEQFAEAVEDPTVNAALGPHMAFR